MKSSLIFLMLLSLVIIFILGIQQVQLNNINTWIEIHDLNWKTK